MRTSRRKGSTAIAGAICGAVVLAALACAFNGGPSAASGCTQDPAAPAQYIGVGMCTMCHKAPEKGNQLAKWQEMGHSKAYSVLKSDKAKEIGDKKGISDPQNSDECRRCHVTGHGEPAGRFAKEFKIADGIQCESCHGPGSAYGKMATMKDRKASVAAGMVIPTKETCEKCHNKDSPTYKPFCFAHFLAKVIHPNPEVKHEVRTLECTCDEKADLKINEDGTTAFVKKNP